MRRFLIRTALVVALYAAGFAHGATVMGRLILQDGETWGARIIAAGVRLANAGAVPLWEVAIRPEENPVPTAMPVVAKRGK